MSLAHTTRSIPGAAFRRAVAVDPALEGLERIESIVKHRVMRRYSDKPVDPELVRLICACGLSSPSKSDLQQRDIVWWKTRPHARRSPT